MLIFSFNILITVFGRCGGTLEGIGSLLLIITINPDTQLLSSISIPTYKTSMLAVRQVCCGEWLSMGWARRVFVIGVLF